MLILALISRYAHEGTIMLILALISRYAHEGTIMLIIIRNIVYLFFS